MSNVESFAALIAKDKTVAAHFDSLSAKLASELKHPITREQLMSMTSVRLAALSLSEPDADDFAAELAVVSPEFQKANEEAQQIQILMEKNLQEAEAAEAALGLADMDPATRLSYARANGLISAKTEPAKPAEHSPEDKAALIAQASKMGPSRRAAFARQHGLL